MPQPSILETLKQLRAVPPDRERALIGYETIARWFAEMVWLTREGRPSHWTTLKRWKRCDGLPVDIVLFGRAWTTNFLLTAWCLSPQAQRLSPRRPDGTLKRAVNAYRGVRWAPSSRL